MSIKEKELIETTLLRISKNRYYNWSTSEIEVGIARSLLGTVTRLFRTYSCCDKIDFLSHLRQVCTYLRSEIRVPEDAYEWAKAKRNQYGFMFDIERRAISVRPYVMTEYEDLKHSYSFVKKRKLKSSYPDVVLHNIFGYESYISLQQKMMIHTLKKMSQGSTLLACLPTGSGKSLLWQYAVAIGKFPATTIVVVPTNALGTDHVKSDQETLSKLPWIESINYSSEAYSGNTEKLNTLCEKIIDEQQRIIYISPEGLTNKTIKEALLKSASKGNLSAIVIDEAHLVVDWGMKFRPEFQFLPGVIRQIKEKCNHSLYTALLSATFTDNDRDVLLNLFGDEKVYEYRGDELRSEISYYRHHCKSENERQDLLIKLLYVVPKPAIVYVGTVANSELYERIIKNAGFLRTERFNGDTNDKERERLIAGWRNNEIDIMVATSAFGMGVDKADVRTVITAYIPENISRYYQEVGRSGRDGYSALNFVLFCPIVDSGLVNNNTDKRLISTENLWKRWEALQENAKVPPGENDCYIFDTDTKHKDLAYELTGGYNSGWNDNVISMLARAGYIDIIDVWRKAASNNHKAYYIKVRIKNLDICFNEQEYIKKIDAFRDAERNEIVSGKESIKSLFDSDDWGCYANAFTFSFLYAGMLCSGCPYCRKNEVPEYKDETRSYLLTTQKFSHYKKYHYRNFASVCTDHKSTTLIGYENHIPEREMHILVNKLIVAEATILVFEDCTKLNIDSLIMSDNNEVLILTIDELEHIQDTYIVGTIVFFFGQNLSNNKRMLSISKRYKKRAIDVNQIFVAPFEYYDEEEKRKLIDCVEDVKVASTIIDEVSLC